MSRIWHRRTPLQKVLLLYFVLDNDNFLENTTSRRYKYGQSTANKSMTVEHLQSFLRDIDQVCMFCKSLFSFSTFSFGHCIILSVFFSIDGFWLPSLISPNFSWQQRLLHFMEDIYNCFWIYKWILGEFTLSYMLIVAYFKMPIWHAPWMAKLLYIWVDIYIFSYHWVLFHLYNIIWYVRLIELQMCFLHKYIYTYI